MSNSIEQKMEQLSYLYSKRNFIQEVVTRRREEIKDLQELLGGKLLELEQVRAEIGVLVREIAQEFSDEYGEY